MELPWLGSAARLGLDAVSGSLGLVREGLVRLSSLMPVPEWPAAVVSKPTLPKKRAAPVVAVSAAPARVRIVAVGRGAVRLLRAPGFPGGLVALAGTPAGGARHELQTLLEQADLVVVAGSCAAASEVASVALAMREIDVPVLVLASAVSRKRGERLQTELDRMASAANVVFPILRDDGKGAAAPVSLPDAAAALTAAVRAPEVPLALRVEDLAIPRGAGVLGAVAQYQESAPGWPFASPWSRLPDRLPGGIKRLSDARRVWLWIEGGENLTVDVADRIAAAFRSAAPPDAAIAFAAATSDGPQPTAVTAFVS